MNIGICQPRPGYLQGLKDLLHRHGALLIFDEVKSGATVAYGGAAERYGVQPDLACWAKAICGGTPGAAFGGRTDVMEAIDSGAAQQGTFNGNPLIAAAGLATLVAAVFGEQLVLRRRIEAVVGESRLRVHDVVENVGHDLTPHMLLYHVNAGFPVVDEGSELLVAATAVQARGDHPVEGYATMAAPTAGFVEQVFEHELGGEPDGSVPAAVVNRTLGIGLYQLFDRRRLPHHFVWRTLGEGTYVVGMEPCTNRTAGRLDARDRGELIQLAAGETREYDLELGALDGGVEIDAFAERVRRALP